GDVRQYVLQRDPRLALSRSTGRENEFARPEADGPGACDARKDWNIEYSDRNDGVDSTRAKDRGDHDRREQGGKRKDNIVEAHQRFVEPSAPCCGPAAERYA